MSTSQKIQDQHSCLQEILDGLSHAYKSNTMYKKDQGKNVVLRPLIHIVIEELLGVMIFVNITTIAVHILNFL